MVDTFSFLQVIFGLHALPGGSLFNLTSFIGALELAEVTRLGPRTFLSFLGFFELAGPSLRLFLPVVMVVVIER